jgi:hypothetical protein
MTGITNVQLLLDEMGVFQNFWGDWPGTMIVLISISQVARITGVSHCAWLLTKVLKDKNYIS